MTDSEPDDVSKHLEIARRDTSRALSPLADAFLGWVDTAAYEADLRRQGRDPFSVLFEGVEDDDFRGPSQRGVVQPEGPANVESGIKPSGPEIDL